MGNNFFKFKQFTIHQSRATLKVCTESCLFGAYIPCHDKNRILDIGTGTGLLALMLAQKNDTSIIDAVELDQPSFEDAQDNFQNSPWSNRLQVTLGNIQEYSTMTPHKYDLIVCNPPFFIKQLKSPDSRTNSALHGKDLKPSDLLTIVNALSNVEGIFYVLLPDAEMKSLMAQFVASQWQLIDYVEVYQTDEKPIFRSIAGFKKTNIPQQVKESQIIIYENDRSYTEDFKNLLQDYYLYL